MLNLKSKLLNQAALAKLLNLSRQTFRGRLNGNPGYKAFNDVDRDAINQLIINELKLK